MRKYTIQVRNAGGVIKTIQRVITARQIGNFNPLFARYSNKTYLVKSDAGDVSDPFRRDASYANSFYIEI